MMRDRTQEFLAITQQARQRGVIPAMNPSNHHLRKQQATEFKQQAGEIGRKVHEVAHKLAHLTDLAKRTSNFDDNTSEINMLIGSIQDEMKGLNSRIAALATLQQEGQPVRGQQKEHSEHVVGVLRSNLMRTAADFESTLHLQMENMKKKQDRRNQFCSSNVFANYRGDPTYYQTSLPRRRSPPRPGGEAGGGDVVLEIGEAAETQALLHQEQYSDSRAVAVQNIDGIISDLGRVFNQLATMVSQQQEQIERIDANVEESLHQVEEGHAQLLKYMKTISSNRPLILKTFLAIIITMILYIVLS